MHLGSNLVAPDLKINLSFKARQIVCVNPFLCFLVLVNDNHQLNARNWCDWEMPHGRGEEKKKTRNWIPLDRNRAFCRLDGISIGSARKCRDVMCVIRFTFTGLKMCCVFPVGLLAGKKKNPRMIRTRKACFHQTIAHQISTVTSRARL